MAIFGGEEAEVGGVLGGGGDLDEGEDEILAVGWEDEMILGASFS